MDLPHSSSIPASSPELPGSIALLAWMGGAIVTLLVPLIFFIVGYQTLSAGLSEAAQLSSYQASVHLQKSGAGNGMGIYTPQTVIESLVRQKGHTRARVLDGAHHVLADSAALLKAPVMTRVAMLQPTNRDIWWVELSRSERPLLIYTFAMLIPGLLFGWLTFSALRVLPMRAFRLALEEIDVRRNTELRLAKSLSLFSATLESTADGILVTDPSGRTIVTNQRFLDMWGISQETKFGGGDVEALSILAGKLRDPASFIASQRKLTQSVGLDHGEVLELRDGRIFEWYSQPQRVDGIAVGRVSSFRDITARKRAEVLLSAEKQVLEMVVSGAPLVEALSVLAQHVEVLSGEMFCSILFRENGEDRRLLCATGPSLPSTVAVRISECGYEVLSAVFAEGRSCDEESGIYLQVQTDPRWVAYRRLVAQWELLPCLSAPICSSGGQLLGIIVAHYRSKSDQQSQDFELLRVATNLTSIAIERRQAEARLDVMAHYDALTQLPNRALFRDRLNLAMARSDRNKELIAVMFLDLDRFKTINDTLGHDAGDMLLREVAARLYQCVREEDTVARLGGDEFTIVLEQIGKAEDAAVVANKILETLAPPIMLNGQETFVTSSIGVTVYPVDSDNFDDLLKNADTAMYRAKEGGGNSYRFFMPEMNVKAGERLKLESGLRRALERNEYVVYYQPKVDLATGKITGAEALLRWKHPEWGLVSPVEFIPILEETGLIEPVGEWVLRTVCTQNRIWQNSDLPDLCVAVNLSGRQLQQNNQHTTIANTVARLLEETGLRPECLELEVTESMLMHEPQYAAELLREIRTKGVVSIHVDDFGTGYSSLSYLKRFPIDALKLDKSFVQGLPDDEEDIAISKAVIALAHSLKLKVIAEGVETPEQLALLRDLGCDLIQGYIISPPLPADGFAQFVRAGVHLERWLNGVSQIKPVHESVPGIGTDNAAV